MKIRRQIMMALCAMAVSLADAQTHAVEPSLSIDVIKAFFAQMPDSVVPHMTKNNRLDMMDFMDAKMKAEVTNKLGGKSEMTDMSASYMRITISKSCDMQIRSLHSAAGDTLMAVAITIGATDSELFGYDLQWNRIGDDMMPELLGPTMTQQGYMGCISLNAHDTTAMVTLSNPFILPDEKGDAPSMPPPFMVRWDAQSLNFVKP